MMFTLRIRAQEDTMVLVTPYHVIAICMLADLAYIGLDISFTPSAVCNLL